jgi:hypothetical protein
MSNKLKMVFVVGLMVMVGVVYYVNIAKPVGPEYVVTKKILVAADKKSIELWALGEACFGSSSWDDTISKDIVKKAISGDLYYIEAGCLVQRTTKTKKSSVYWHVKPIDGRESFYAMTKYLEPSTRTKSAFTEEDDFWADMRTLPKSESLNSRNDDGPIDWDKIGDP